MYVTLIKLPDKAKISVVFNAGGPELSQSRKI